MAAGEEHFGDASDARLRERRRPGLNTHPAGRQCVRVGGSHRR
jgi:hypothetical protein